MRIYRAVLLAVGIAGLVCAWVRAVADVESRSAPGDLGEASYSVSIGLIDSPAGERGHGIELYNGVERPPVNPAVDHALDVPPEAEDSGGLDEGRHRAVRCGVSLPN